MRLLADNIQKIKLSEERDETTILTLLCCKDVYGS